LGYVGSMYEKVGPVPSKENPKKGGNNGGREGSSVEIGFDKGGAGGGGGWEKRKNSWKPPAD